MIQVIIPSRTGTFVQSCLASLMKSSPPDEWRRIGHVTVVDNGIDDLDTAMIDRMTHGWFVVERILYRPARFIFAEAVNLGLKACPRNRSGVLLLNDDADVVSPEVLGHASQLLLEARARGFGAISAQVVQGAVGNPDQLAGVSGLVETRKAIAFVAALLPEATLEAVGLLDERFDAYGWEDTDYSRRVILAGLRIGVTGAIRVAHGRNGRVMHSSYMQTRSGQEMRTLFLRGRAQFAAKWGEAVAEDPLRP